MPFSGATAPWGKWSQYTFIESGVLFLWLHWVFTAAHRFFSSGASGSYSLVVVPGLLIVVACLFTDHRLKGMPASVVVVHGLSSYGSPALEHWLNSCGMRLSCPVAYGIILDWGWNLCLLHWQVNSYLLLYHGSPEKAFLILNDGRLHQNLFFV